MTFLVIGVGSEAGSDDAIGLLVAEQVRQVAPAGLRIRTATVPIELLDLWCEQDDVVLVDAVRSGGAPGVVIVRDLGSRGSTGPGGGGTHGFGIGEVLDLARVLHRLPRSLTLVGVEGAAFGAGTGPTDRVTAAVPEAVRAVLSACSSDL